MLHSGLKMKLVSRSERLDCEGLVGATPRQDVPRAFPHLQVFVLLLVLLKSEVATSFESIRDRVFRPSVAEANFESPANLL